MDPPGSPAGSLDGPRVDTEGPSGSLEGRGGILGLLVLGRSLGLFEAFLGGSSGGPCVIIG